MRLKTLHVLLILFILTSCKPDQESAHPEAPSGPPDTSGSTMTAVTEDSDGEAVFTAEEPLTEGNTVTSEERPETGTAEAYIYHGKILSNEGKYKEAIEAYKKAVDLLENDSAEIHFNFGYAYLMMNDEKSAFNEYKALRRISPEMAENLYYMATKKAMEDSDNRFIIQVGAYTKRENAERILRQLKKRRFFAFIKRNRNLNIVRLGGLKTYEEGMETIGMLRRELDVSPFLLNHNR